LCKAPSMVIVMVTIVIEAIIASVLVGATCASIWRSWDFRISGWRMYILYIGVFMLLDAYYMPALHTMNMIVTVRNQEIAEFFAIRPNTNVGRLFGIGPLDVIPWCVKSVLARRTQMLLSSQAHS
jgi:hypothetical protein